MPLKKRVFHQIIIGVAILVVMISMVVFVFYNIGLMLNYKVDTIKDTNYILSLLDMDYMKTLYAATEKAYIEWPVEFADEPFSQESYEYLLDNIELSEDFRNQRNIVKKYREKQQLSNCALGFLDAERQRFVYVVDGDEYENAYVPGLWISHEDGDLTTAQMIQRVMNSNLLMIPHFGHAHGWTLTNFCELPTLSGNGFTALAMIDVEIGEVIRNMTIIMLGTILFFFVISAIAAEKNASFFDRQIVKPMLELSSAAKEYTARDKAQNEEDSHLFENLDIRTGDEIETLSDSLADMERDLNSTIKRIRAMTVEKEIIKADLALAADIQRSQLPVKFPAFPDHREFDINAVMIPARDVGGDFYDFFMTDDSHIALVIADVSDKGVSAALFMMVAKALLKNALMKGESPAEALKGLNRQLMENNESDQFVTLWVCVIDLTCGRGLACNAGHERPVLKRATGEFETVFKQHFCVVAWFEDAPYSDHEFQLNSGDTLFVHTDGVIDAENEKREMFGSERMLAALNRQKDASLEKLLQNVMEDVMAFRGTANQFDDITMLAFTFNGTGEN